MYAYTIMHRIFTVFHLFKISIYWFIYAPGSLISRDFVVGMSPVSVDLRPRHPRLGCHGAACSASTCTHTHTHTHTHTPRHTGIAELTVVIRHASFKQLCTHKSPKRRGMQERYSQQLAFTQPITKQSRVTQTTILSAAPHSLTTSPRTVRPAETATPRAFPLPQPARVHQDDANHHRRQHATTRPTHTTFPASKSTIRSACCQATMG